MKLWNRIMKDESGVLTFEWILLLTVLVIGITGGLSAVRDALLTELGDVAEAMIALDQSYFIVAPWEICTPECTTDVPWDGGTWSYYKDQAHITAGRVGSDGARGGKGTTYQKPTQTVHDNQDSTLEQGTYTF